MRRLIGALALASGVLGCGIGLRGEPVALVTGVEACYAGGQSPTNGGLLVPDPQYGTRFADQGPVMWPVGYTGVRLADGRVAVLNRSGEVIATTGKEYRFSPVPQQSAEAERVIARIGAIPVCDAYAWDFEAAGE